MMILLDAEKDVLAFSGTIDDLENEAICILKCIQQKFINRNENESFVRDIIDCLNDEELNIITKEFMKVNTIKKGKF